MTTDNASGAGMEPLTADEVIAEWTRPCYHADVEPAEAFEAGVRFAERHHAAESQAHNAKLEAQVERMRLAILSLMNGSTQSDDGGWGRICMPNDAAMDLGLAALKP